MNDTRKNDIPVAGRTSPRVLVVAPSPKARGGIASVVARHRSTAAWAQFGCRVLPTVRGNTALIKGLTALWAYLRAPFMLLRSDIVHVHVAAGISAVRKCPIIWMAAVLRRKVILHFHCAGAESLFESTPAMIQRFLRSHADLVIVLSPWWKSEFERRWPGIRTAILPNPVPSVETTQCERESDILFVGALTTRKGYDLLLEAMVSVVRQIPSTQLWMAGEGEMENAKALVRRLGIERSVRFLGWVSGETLQELYAQAKILCLPSFAEGVPMAVLESMMHGVAVITTPVGGIPDVVIDGENGILVPPGDTQAISEALLRLLRNPEERRRLGRAGQFTVKNSNSIPCVSKLLGEIYSGLDHRPLPTRAAHSMSAGYPG